MTIGRFFIFNLAGNFLPLVVALVAMPVVAQLAGVERLGVLTVVWTLVGYFGFLDFGLSRVVTRRLAKAVDQGRTAQELTELRGFFCWWVLPALLLLACVFLASRTLLSGFFHGGSLGQELTAGWAWIAYCLPVTLATNWLRGALEGLQRFARVNVLRTVFGAWTYAAPALVAYYLPTLDAMIIAIVVGRVLALLAHAWACKQVERGIVLGPAPRHWGRVKLFFKEGGWMSVSNLISPMMVYFDRFVLAALVPARAVAWYATSQEAMLGARLIPGALAGVLFPKFAAASDASTEIQVVNLYAHGIRIVAALMLPLCVLAATCAYDGMRLWMGDAFAENSYRVVEIIAVGLFANSIAQLPYAWLQGVGRSRITAQIHLAELPIYALGLYFCVGQWGIIGAAWMWTFRISLDCLLLLIMAVRSSARETLVVGLAGVSWIAIVGFLTGPQWSWQWRAGICALSLITTLVYAWFGLLNKDDRDKVLRFRHAN
jgi:O-antigen/teichoic acid export membrane protein